MNRQGKGFLQPDDASLKEIAIPENATGTALHEDRVLVRREVRARGLRSDDAGPATGAVVRILERQRTQMVGTLKKGRQFLYVIPDDPRIPHDIYVPEPRDLGARHRRRQGRGGTAPGNRATNPRARSLRCSSR
jgi:ribonuclease R